MTPEEKEKLKYKFNVFVEANEHLPSYKYEDTMFDWFISQIEEREKAEKERWELRTAFEKGGWYKEEEFSKIIKELSTLKENLEADVVMEIAKKIIAIPDNLPEHAADHKLKLTYEIIQHAMRMAQRHPEVSPTEPANSEPPQEIFKCVDCDQPFESVKDMAGHDCNKYGQTSRYQ